MQLLTAVPIPVTSCKFAGKKEVRINLVKSAQRRPMER